MVDNSFLEGVVGDSKDSAPLGKRVSFTERCYEMTGGPIIAVHLLRDPSAVFRGIALVIVDSIYRKIISIAVFQRPFLESVWEAESLTASRAPTDTLPEPGRRSIIRER